MEGSGSGVGGGAKGGFRKPQHVPFSALPPSLQLRRCCNSALRLLRGFRAGARFRPLSLPRCNAWCDKMGDFFENALDWTIRTLGPLYIVVALSLILSVIYLYFTLLLPVAFSSRPTWMGALHMAGALWLALCVLVNYYLCITTDPGTPPQEPALMAVIAQQLEQEAALKAGTKEPQPQPQPLLLSQPQSLVPRRELQESERRRRGGVAGSVTAPSATTSTTVTVHLGAHSGEPGRLFMTEPGSHADVARTSAIGTSMSGSSTCENTLAAAAYTLLPACEASPRGQLHTIRWCKVCKARKAPMTHHCYVCNRCVLRMDHHCPWMHNCVGFRNYRYFFCFVLYLWIGCIYAVHIAWACILSQRHPDTGVVFTFVVSLAVFVSLSLLLAWHAYLVGTAQTTVDFYDYRVKRQEAKRAGKVWRNEFDLGWRRNFVVALQLSPPLWGLGLLLPQVVRMQGDGMSFPTLQSCPPKMEIEQHHSLTVPPTIGQPPLPPEVQLAGDRGRQNSNSDSVV